MLQDYHSLLAPKVLGTLPAHTSSYPQIKSTIAQPLR